MLAEGLSLSLVPFYPAPPEIGSRRTPYTVLFLSQQLFTYHYQQLYYLQREKHETLLRILLGAVLIPLILGPPACQLIPTLGKFRHKSAAASIQQGPEPAQLTHFDHRCDSGTRTHLSVPSANAETRTSFSIIAPGVPTASHPPNRPRTANGSPIYSRCMDNASLSGAGLASAAQAHQNGNPASSLSPTSPVSVRSQVFAHGSSNGASKRKRSSVAMADSPESADDDDGTGEHGNEKKRQPGVKRACNECRQQKVRVFLIQCV